MSVDKVTARMLRYLIVTLAACLALYHFAAQPILSHALRVQVLRRLVPRVPPVANKDYFSGVLEGLGLRPLPISSAIDVGLVKRIDRTPGGAAPWRVYASYALLATSPDVASAQRWLAQAPQTSSDARLVWLWRGRAAWVRGDKAAALRSWYEAFGTDYIRRDRLAKGLYLAGELPLAIDATLSMFELRDTDEHQRGWSFETLRYWMFWQARSQEQVLAWCDRILTPQPQSAYDASSDVQAADLFALRAFSLLGLGWAVEGRESLEHAECLRNSPYVRSVRALERFRSGDMVRAAQTATAAAEQAGSDGHALLLAGHVLWELGDRATAMSAWQQVVERDPLLAVTAQGRIAVAMAQR